MTRGLARQEVGRELKTKQKAKTVLWNIGTNLYEYIYVNLTRTRCLIHIETG